MKSLVLGMVTSFGVVGQWGPTDSQTLQCPCYSPELESMTQLLKIPHLWVIEHREIRLYSYWLAFTVLGGAIHTPWGRKCIIHLTQLWNLWVVSMTNLARHAHWYNSGMNVIEPTAFWLDLSPTLQDETHTWHHYQAKKRCLDRP